MTHPEPNPPPQTEVLTSRRERMARWAFHPPPFRIAFPAVLLRVVMVVSGLGIAATAAAAVGAFRLIAPLIWFAAIVGVAWLVNAIIQRRFKIRLDAWEAAALGLAAIAFLSAGFGFQATYQAHSDAGFYQSDAILMATTGGRVLEGAYVDLLPGFASAEGGVKISAMFGYPAFCALGVYVAGLNGFGWMSAVLSGLTVLSIFMVARHFGARVGAIVAMFFHLSSQLGVWFARIPMTENASSFVFWVAAWLVFEIRKDARIARFASLAIVLIFGILVRPEGILLAIAAAIIVSVSQRRRLRQYVTALDPKAVLALLFGVLALGGIAAATLAALPSAYLSSNLRVASQIFETVPIADAEDVPVEGPEPNWGNYALRYEWDSAKEYGLHWFLGLAVIGFALGIYSRRKAGRLIALSLPYILFVLMPPVTVYHPWFMRRLWIALVPLTFLFASLSLDPRLLAERLRSFRSPRALRTRTPWLTAVIVLLVSFPHLDPTASIVATRESDSTRPLLDWIDATLPADAVVLSEFEVVGRSTSLRLLKGRDVIAWFLEPVHSLSYALQAKDSEATLFLLKINSTVPRPVVEAFPGGGRAFDFVTPLGISSQFNPRAYLAHPPLEEGYAPLRRYLDADVPERLHHRTVRTQLVEIPQGSALLRSIEVPDPTQWAPADHGPVARADNASLAVDLDGFSAASRNEVRFGLYLFTDALPTGPVFGVTANQSTPLVFRRTEQVAPNLFLIGVKLESPLILEQVRLPAGFQLAGAYVGPWEG